MLLISAQFRPTQQYFRFYGAVGRRALHLFDRIFLVDANSNKLLKTINVKTGIVCGDTRYDRVIQVAQNVDSVEKVAQFKADTKLIVCGSTWKEDEVILSESIKKFPEIKWVIAPHEVEESNLQRLEKLFGNTVRLSEYDGSSNARVLLVDGIGILNRIYRYA
ncbi:MAG: 3-deoxy-D-manno-octulosonic acid transferase, partial [Flavobacteriales bacterium]|nr:3-deoxy-D-manno-octulosonic acid transferase [Flavobacteriales bacterium]